jgi:hypothetical protein
MALRSMFASPIGLEAHIRKVGEPSTRAVVMEHRQVEQKAATEESA